MSIHDGTLRDGLAILTRYFREAGCTDPGGEARLVLSHVTGIERGRLVLYSADPLPEAQFEDCLDLFTRRSMGEPMSHILGYREFYGRRFSVDNRVLDPRPETETLIEQALAAPFSSLLDLGTGSGCILVTLLAERPKATGIGTDLSPAALEVARANAEALGVAGRCDFEACDWFGAVGGQYDLIVSNPPYIAAGEMTGLAPELAYEPRSALTDEADGLSAYRVIVTGAPAHLTPGGRLMVEIGPTQGAPVWSMFTAAGFDDVQIFPDLDGRDRVVSGCWTRKT